MKVEVLYFAGCPNHPPAVNRVREALRAEGVTANVFEVEVKDADSANAVGFLGSPTIRINGQDVELAARSAQGFGWMCRTYTGYGSRAGVPPVEWIRAAVREARNANEVLI
jgi:Domain of unknown function (DUF2703)